MPVDMRSLLACSEVRPAHEAGRRAAGGPCTRCGYARDQPLRMGGAQRAGRLLVAAPLNVPAAAVVLRAARGEEPGGGGRQPRAPAAA